MCKPFSCLVKSDLAVIVGQTVTTHSHSVILRQHGLPQEISIDQYARVELLIDDDYPSDPDKWALMLDEDREPSWWAANLPEIEDRVRQAAWSWLAKIKAAKEFLLKDDDILYLPFGSPVVEMHVGELWCHDHSAPVVNQTGGFLRAYGHSAPVVSMTGGWLVAYDRAAPVVTLSGGDLCTFDNSAPVVNQTGGFLRAYDHSAPVVTLIGGEMRAYEHSAPVVNGVQLRPGQMAEIVDGKLQITDF